MGIFYHENNVVHPAEVPEVLLVEVGMTLVLQDAGQMLLGAAQDLLHLPPEMNNLC